MSRGSRIKAEFYEKVVPVGGRNRNVGFFEFCFGPIGRDGEVGRIS
jgi:hypothetical protein